nr:PilN domain-containing protein [Ectothiorhodospira shaposhnikovii]
MDRHTPFPANRVYHAWEVLRRDASAGRLQVALVVVPRERVDEPLAQLRTLGLEVRRAIPEQLPLEQAQSRWFNLLPRDETGAGRPRPGRAQLAVASLVAALLVTLLLPLWQHRAISIQYLDELRALAPQVSRLSAAQDRREQLREALEAPLRAREAQVPATELLAEITRLLPDHTWLTSLRLEGRELHLEGDSAAASALIEALEDSPLLANVRFLASVQRRGDGRERFTLGAEALPAAAEETP